MAIERLNDHGSPINRRCAPIHGGALASEATQPEAAGREAFPWAGENNQEGVMLALDADHIYRDEAGRIVPSVTQIIKRVYGPAPGMEYATQYHMDRGSAAHAVYDLLAREAVGDYDIDPALLPYIEGWRAWRAAWPCEIVDAEVKVHNETLGYAGTLDLVVKRNRLLTIVDFKQTCSDRDYLQMAAYAGAYPVKVGAVVPIEIDGSGGYRLGKVISGTTLESLRNEWRATMAVYRRMTKERGE